MSDLQTDLIIIGALIIIVVLVVNWWQERRFHQQVEKNFSLLHSDALLDDPKIDLNKVDDAFEDLPGHNFTFDNERTYQLLRDQNTNKDIEFSSYRNIKKDSRENQFQAETLPDDISIEDAFSELTNAISKGASLHHSEDKTNSSKSAGIKPIKHDDIKAIFEDAFNHKNKVNDLHQQTKLDINENSSDLNIEENLKSTVIQEESKESSVTLPTMLHAHIDLTAVLYLAVETHVHALVKSLDGLLDGYDKPTYVHVLNANDHWVLLKDVPDNEKVTKVTCSMQLADRSGGASRNVLNRFQLAVETFGLDINAHVEWQSSGDALNTASALDTFCIEVDKTIGFHLIHGENGVFTGTKLRGLAEAQGMILAPDGSFKYMNEYSQASFIMFNRENHPFNQEMLRNSVVKGITFQLDIPHVKECAEAFSHMVQVAKQMEIGLNAMLIDDNNKMLGDIQIEKIRQQLKVIHATMLVRGIVPGSDNALRLFS